ncbi:MAG: RsmB/NOP family class I SAM-dependent RNA methyltransferase, partial [Myxococcota bacterium]
AAAERSGPWGGLVEALARVGEGAPPVERLALRHAMPRPVVERLVAERGPDDAEAFLVASDVRAPIDLRPNPRRCGATALAERLADEGVPTSPLPGGGLRVEGRANLEGLASFRDGWFEVQDEGSQRVAALVPPGVTVLDVCAGAGGKSLAFAGAGCRVTALDVRASALDELAERARRAGVRVATRAIPPDRFPDDLRPAEWVVVDAPCTGTGTLRRHPEHRWWWTEDAVRESAARQRELLGRAARWVAPGGRLVYATCSVLVDEDERIASEVGGFTVTEEIRTWPQSDRCDGFYAAVLARA